MPPESFTVSAAAETLKAMLGDNPGGLGLPEVWATFKRFARRPVTGHEPESVEEGDGDLWLIVWGSLSLREPRGSQDVRD